MQLSYKPLCCHLYIARLCLFSALLYHSQGAGVQRQQQQDLQQDSAAPAAATKLPLLTAQQQLRDSGEGSSAQPLQCQQVIARTEVPASEAASSGGSRSGGGMQAEVSPTQGVWPMDKSPPGNTGQAATAAAAAAGGGGGSSSHARNGDNTAAARPGVPRAIHGHVQGSSGERSGGRSSAAGAGVGSGGGLAIFTDAIKQVWTGLSVWDGGIVMCG